MNVGGLSSERKVRGHTAFYFVQMVAHVGWFSILLLWLFNLPILVWYHLSNGSVLIQRVMEETEEAIGEEQCSFRKGRGCVDQIFTLRQLCEKVCGKGKLLYLGFMDLEKAYDRVDRKGVWEVLEIYGIGGRNLEAVKSFYEGCEACVRVENEESEMFKVNVGLRQGCVMSPWLFNLYMDGDSDKEDEGGGIKRSVHRRGGANRAGRRPWPGSRQPRPGRTRRPSIRPRSPSLRSMR